jgi:hypothetical protein
LIKNEVVPKVDRYKYLGVWLTEEFGALDQYRGDLRSHVKDRLLCANKLLNETRPFLRMRSIPVHLRLRVLRSQLIPILTYGAEWMGLHSQTILHRLRSPLSKALKWIIGYKASNKVCQAAILYRELGIPFPEATVARARVKAFFNWHRSKTQISTLLENPYRSRTRTWVTHTVHYLRSIIGISLEDIEEGKLNSGKAEDIAMKVVKHVTQGIIEIETKNEYSGSMKEYSECGFEETRDYIKHATWLPGLSDGVSWLIRFRTNSVWTRKRLRAYSLRLDGGVSIPRRDEDRCASCKKNIEYIDERWHLLIECEKYGNVRQEIIGKYIKDARETGEHLVRELGEHVRCQVEVYMAILLLGGYNGSSNWYFTKAFGHRLEVDLGGHRYAYGFVPVALFLARVMSTHVDNIFRSVDLSQRFGHRKGGYITDSQSDF